MTTKYICESADVCTDGDCDHRYPHVCSIDCCLPCPCHEKTNCIEVKEPVIVPREGKVTTSDRLVTICEDELCVCSGSCESCPAECVHHPVDIPARTYTDEDIDRRIDDAISKMKNTIVKSLQYSRAIIAENFDDIMDDLEFDLTHV